MSTNNKPVHVIRCGNTKASCSLQSTLAGYFYDTTIRTQYKDKQTDEWGDSNSFSDRNLLAVAHAAREMYRWIRRQKSTANVQNHDDSQRHQRTCPPRR